MSTFCNFHCVVVVVCGGDFCVVCVRMRVCVCVCVCVCVASVCEQHGVTCTVWVGESVCVCGLHSRLPSCCAPIQGSIPPGLGMLHLVGWAWG